MSTANIARSDVNRSLGSEVVQGTGLALRTSRPRLVTDSNGTDPCDLVLGVKNHVVLLYMNQRSIIGNALGLSVRVDGLLTTDRRTSGDTAGLIKLRSADLQGSLVGDMSVTGLDRVSVIIFSVF